jgi:hypothetical protein
MVEMEKAWVQDYSIVDIVERVLTTIGPNAINRLSVFSLDGKDSKGGDTKIKVVDILAIELGKPNELSNITDNLGFWPGLKQLMLRLSWSVPLWTYIVPNKFKLSRKYMTLLEAEGQGIRQANA